MSPKFVTSAEARVLRDDLEHELLRALTEFEQVTGMEIYSVSLDHTDVQNIGDVDRHRRLWKVRIGVLL